ncbi:SDR family oxidoreductase [Streptococcus sp. CSL10205-OR2]|uniref:SDR family oxidoreductase n=1 Tax=Streptococcus sp. CSL10205-OR2 TaxID=2980558 RepID=UPI0021D82D14|nr:SDR family oxidoreductase [Streptococcus sp. CSL10205-OR2]MCU9534058.1 SDR family oxidoreductase [Streptococcus sp. CSL10205-OR2]
MMTNEKVLLAGATGYLGRFVMQELIKRGYRTKIIVRNKNNVNLVAPNLEIVEAQVTSSEDLKGICEDIDIVISTVGITRQKDGLTYMDVDYQANANLINDAKKSGVKKFIYVSVFKGEQLRHLKICEAKEKLGDYLKASGLDYAIIRPNGFFSDMAEFLNMAKNGTVYLFGDGTLKLNPIHGKDLAIAVVDSIVNDEKELAIGGPELLSQNEMAVLALKAYHKKIRIVHLPDFLRRLTLSAIRTFTGQKIYGPLEFIMTTMAMDMSAPKFGTEKLEDFFNQEVKNIKKRVMIN